MGLRGPHAVGLLSLWRPSPKPLRKRRCARCDQLFKPLRRDAKFCSGRCRTDVYRMRIADDAKADDRPIFTVSFRAEQGIDGVRAFKALVRFALRKYGLRAVTVREEPAKDAAA